MQTRRQWRRRLQCQSVRHLFRFPLPDVGALEQKLSISCVFFFFNLSAVRQAEGNSPERRSLPGESPTCDEEVETQDRPSPLQEVALDVQEVNMDCPICQGSFPVDQIEMHAAYCDGAPADSPPGCAVPGQGLLCLPVVSSASPYKFGFQRHASTSPPCAATVSAKPRRKRMRRCEAGDGASGPAPSTSRLVGATSDPFSGVTFLLTWVVLLPRDHMKCFICQSAIPVQDYSHHTDLCISRQDGASAAVKLPKFLPSLLPAMAQMFDSSITF